VQGSANTTGASLMQSNGQINYALLPESTANLLGYPLDGMTVGAWLFWSGARAPGFGADQVVSLRLPTGDSFPGLRVSQCEPGETPCDLSASRCVVTSTPTIPLDFYYCRRDVTGLLARMPLGTGGAALPFTVGGVAADPGIPDPGSPGDLGRCAPMDPYCQAKYAGWSLVVVWRSDSSTVTRDAALFDGFLYADEDYGIPGGGSGVSQWFSISGFNARAGARAELSLFALEGDAQLGAPPQDSPASAMFCPTCTDWMEVRTASHGSAWRVTDGSMNNPPGNLFNSSLGSLIVGVDIDKFDIGTGSADPVVNAGDTYLDFRIGSGDGQPGGDFGGGELYFLGYVFVALDTDAPRLNNSSTTKSASLSVVSPGQVIAYTIRLKNDGTADALNTTVRDAIPANTTYVASSTTNTCGVSSADVGGTSPLVGGLNVGRFTPLTPACEVRFQVRVNGTVPNGTIIRNVATISADGTDPFTREATTTVQGGVITRLDKTVSGTTGGGATPGTVLTYTLTAYGSGAQVNNVVISDPLDPGLEGISVTLRPAGSTLDSDAATGLVQVSNITVPATGSVEVRFTARVRAGLADGTAIPNQAHLTQPGATGTVDSDDPGTSAPVDPTVVFALNRLDLTTSTKTVLRPADGDAQPGEEVRWRIRLVNSGNRTATVAVQDDLPRHVSGCTVVTAPPGFACGPGGANGTGVVTGTVTLAPGATQDVEFRVVVAASAPDGFALQNTARLTPAEDPARAVTVTAPVVTLLNRPILTTSTKTVQDLNGAPTRPGDTLRFTLTVTNSGSGAATNVTISDTVDPRLVVTLVGQGGVNTGGTIRWTSATTTGLASLPPGGSVSVTFEARVAAGVANGTTISNVGVFGSNEVTPGFSAPPVTVTVTASPALGFTKTVQDVNGGSTRPGDTLRYTLTLTNTGDGAANNVVVTDPLDASLSFVSATGGGTFSGGQVRWTVASLPSGSGNTLTLTFDATVRTPLDNGTVIANQGSVTSSEVSVPVLSDDPALPGGADPTRVTVTSAPFLTMTKVATDVNGGDLLPGETVSYTLILTNTGDAAARNVTVTDAVPATLHTLAPDAGGTVSGNTITWSPAPTPSLAAVVPGTAVVLTFTARVVTPLADGTLISNQASAAPASGAPVLSDDPATPAVRDPTVVRVRSLPLLVITKRVTNVTSPGSTTYRPGDRISYELTFTNTGSETARDIVITDLLPSSLTAIDPGATGQLVGTQVRYDRTSDLSLVAVAPGGLGTRRILATLLRPLDNGTVVSNQAAISATSLASVLSDDPDTSAPRDPTVFTVTSSAVLTFTKTVTDLNGPPYEPRDRIQYTILLTNTGSANARNVVITDPVDFILHSPTPSAGGVLSGGGIRWDATSLPALAVLGPDQTVTLGFSATIMDPVDDGTPVSNQARLIAEGITGVVSDDPNTPVVGDPTVLRITSTADLSASTKEALGPSGRITEARPGEPFTYRITITNRGNAAARNVLVVDDLPAEWVTTSVSSGGTLSGNEARWTGTTTPALMTLLPGGVVSVSVTGYLRIPLDDGTVVGNQARMFLNGGFGTPFVTDDPATPVAGDQTRVTVRSAPLLSDTTKTYVDQDGGNVEPGNLVTYTITVLNRGTASARQVVVTDVVDTARLAIESVGQGGTAAGGTITWNGTGFPALALLAPDPLGVQVTFVARVLTTVPSGTVVHNQGTVAAQGIAALPTDDPTTATVDDPTSFTVRSMPRLALTKDVRGGNRVVPTLTDFTYTLHVANSGSATATGVTLRDTLPARATFVSATGGGLYDAGTRAVWWTLPDLAPFGGESRLELTVQVDDTASDGETVANQAFVASAETGDVVSDDPTTPASGDPTVVTVTAYVDLSGFTKTAQDENLGTLNPGDFILYRLSVVNTGTAAAHSVSVTDQLDGALEVAEVRNGGVAAGNTVTWSQATTAALQRVRPSDGAVVLEVRARVRLGTPDGTRIPNQGSLQARETATPILSDDPATPAVDDPTALTVSAPRVVFLKSFTDLDGAPTIPGDAIRYTLSVENRGTAPAVLVTVTDDLPVGLVDVVLGQGGVLSGPTARWDATTTAALASLNPGNRLDLMVDARVDPLSVGDASFTNRGRLTSPSLAEPLLSDDPATPPEDATVFTLQAQPAFADSSLAIDGTPPSVRPRDTVAYTLTVRNSGTAVARGVLVAVDVDPNLVNLRAEDGGSVAAQRALWDASVVPALAVLRPGDAVALHVKADVRWPLPDGTILSSLGRVSSVEVVTPVEVGPATVRVDSRPRLSASTLELTDVNSGDVEPGDLLNYRLTVLNDGSAAAHRVRVSLPVPAGTAYVPNTTRVAGQSLPDLGGTTALATEVSVGDMDPGSAVVAMVQVRAIVTLPRGYRLAAQAWLRAEETSLVGSDDPRTPEVLGDPTVHVVGGGAYLVAQLTADPTIAAADGTSTLRLALENSGSVPARDIRVLVPVPRTADLLPGTLTLDGQPLTDAPDGDDGGVEEAGWWLRLEELESGDGRVATARIRLKPNAGRAEFQATLERPGVGAQRSDADPSAPGDQSTVVSRRGGAADLGGSTKAVVDLNGGTTQPGDELQFTLVIQNRGASDATLRSPDGFLDALDARLRLVDGTLEPADVVTASGTPSRIVLVPGLSPVIRAQESLTVRFRARVAADTEPGSEIRNTAVVSLADGTRQNLGPVSLTVGSVAGTAEVQGTLFEDVGPHNRVFDGARDRKLAGYQVLLVPLDAGPRATPVMSTLSDENGRYALQAVAPGEYRCRVVSPSGVQFAEHRLGAVAANERRFQDLSVDPSGVVYDAQSLASLAGVVASLYVDDGDNDPANDVPVPEADLPVGQQHQVTGPDGRYRFDPRPGRYRLGLDGPTPTSVWPSAVLPPTRLAGDTHPLGSFAQTDSAGNVVPDETPRPGGNHTYFLRFDLPDANHPVYRNHVPVDPLRSHIRLTKTANKRIVNQGDIVTYTVRVVSNAPEDMSVARMGGMEVADTIPTGFKLIKGSARVDRVVRDSRGRTRRERLVTPDPRGQSLLTFGPFDLLGQSEAELRYQMVVGPSVKFGPQVNRAVLRSAQGQVVASNEADATVEVRPDPLFDEGTVVGKVFCDQDGDGWQGTGEEGVLAARVVLDTGLYAETDDFGRFHFTSVRPGSHMAKLDVNTLPVGSTPTTPVRSLFYVTRGLPSRISFGVTCTSHTAQGATVVINQEAYRPAPKPPAPGATPDQVHVSGSLATGVVELNGTPQETVRAELALVLGGAEPDWAADAGVDLAAFDDVTGPGVKPTFHLRAHTALPVSGWRLVLEDEADGTLAGTWEGAALPAQVPWDGRDAATGELRLKRGHTYLATVAVVAGNGDVGISAPRRLGVRVGTADPEAAGTSESSLDESEGPLFDARDLPVRRLKTWLKQEGRRLLGRGEAVVILEVHGDDRTTPEQALANAERASHARAELTRLGFLPENVQVTGLGGDKPAVPNMGRAQRAMNRRVVLRSAGGAVLGPPLPPFTTTAAVRVNDRDVPVAQDAPWQTDIPVFLGDLIQVDVTQPDGRRVLLTRTYTGPTFVPGAPPPPGTASYPVTGDVGSGTLALGSDHAQVDPAASPQVGPADESAAAPAVDDQGNLDREVVLAMRAPADTESWTLQVLSVPEPPAAAQQGAEELGALPAPGSGDLPGSGALPGPDAVKPGGGGGTDAPAVAVGPDVPLSWSPGPVLWERGGKGSPPPMLAWDGRDAVGKPLVTPGLLAYRLAVTLPGGVTVTSADRYLPVAQRVPPIVVNGAFDAKKGNPTAAARKALREAAERLAAEGGTVEVHVFTDDRLPKMKALLLTQAQAEQVRGLLVAGGVPEAAVTVVGRGSESPVAKGKGAKARTQNRRLEIAYQPVAEAVAPPVLAAPRVEVNGTPVPLTGTTFATRLWVPWDSDVVVAWRSAAGETRVVRRKVADPAEPGVPLTVLDVLGPAPVAGQPRAPVGTPVATPVADVAAVAGEFAPWGGEVTPAPVTGLGGPGGFVLVMAPKPVPDGGVAVGFPDGGEPWRPDPARVPAADLVADLPPDDAILRTDRILVRGITDPTNTIEVNGQQAPVDPRTGQFVAMARLGEGPVTVRVVATDLQGNKGTLSRRYVVDTTGLFIMAFADTAAGGAGAHLDELSSFNMVAPLVTPTGVSLTKGPVFLYGRGVAYVRGKWKGFWRIPFIEATLHLDTSRWAEPGVERDLLGQDTYYPVYGDRGVEVHEARARYPLYARVKAGDNELYVGNTTTKLKGLDLFQYGRARYAGAVTVDQGYLKLKQLGGVDVGHTRASLMVAGGDTPRRPAHLEIRGTGGSLYFLKDRDVIEGSERVYVVVRDAVTGDELMRVQKVRNQDYIIRYREGRIIMSEPLPSTSDNGFIANVNPTAVNNANPVFLVVDYEHEGATNFSELAVGGTVEQTVLDHLALGGGYLLEGRRNHAPSYQLAGVHARAFWDSDNFVQAEWAYSRSVNAENALSNDGGLTYQPLGQGMDDHAVMVDNKLYPAERQGHAFKVKAQVAVGKLLLGKQPTDLALRGYFQRVTSGFFADGSLSDQGQWKYGTEANWQITRRDRVRFRWDGVWSEVPPQAVVLQYRRLHREMAVGQLQHREGPFTLTGEYAFNVYEDGVDFGEVNWRELKRHMGNVVATQLDYQPFERLTLFLRQEGAITSSNPTLEPRWNDRLTTHAGARFKLLDNLSLDVSESVKWNGDNATNIGLRTKIDKTNDVYAQERFQYRQGSWVATSVLGASSEPGPGSRTYAEYQVDHMAWGGQSRGVMGASHQWSLMEGLSFSLGYERVQVIGASTTVVNGPPTSTPYGTPAPAPVSDSYVFAAPGATGAQSPFLGSGSRDAMAAQLSFNTWKWLKLVSRWELRYDNADERRGGYDRLVFFSANDLTWNWTEDLSFVGRFHVAEVQNRTLRVTEAQVQELAAGLAYRPVHHEWLTVLALLRHRLELRPVMLTEGRFERTVADVASMEPVLELPFGLQLVEKVSIKLSREKVEDLKEGGALTALWINRANYHAFRLLKRFVPWFNRFPGDVDVALEYRLRAILTTGQVDHGVVTELGVVPVPFVRLGIGFNFSRVSDDEFARSNQSAFGPYVRLQAQY
jgi:uncharacterized repeat protein (TIGR01451 family)/fimbrial isopeptide formation D2 family protein